jgi:predicted glycogen debranching enzyme
MDGRAEWLEVDGRGGFASGTVGLARTRRYHALLLRALTPPTGRVVLVNGCEAWIETPAGRYALSQHLYGPFPPGVVHPDGARWIEGFRAQPWPRWVFRLEDGTRVAHECLVGADGGPSLLRWQQLDGGPARLELRPLLSGRDYHALQRENRDLCMDARESGARVGFRTYPSLPPLLFSSNGRYRHEPVWLRDFVYAEEAERGLDHREDLASPGVFSFELGSAEAVWLLDLDRADSPLHAAEPRKLARRLRAAERRRRAALSSRLDRSADAYVARRGDGATLLAGFPWFTDWGRDTFIALRGLCLATGRLDLAESILLEWSDSVSEGMLPNRFPDTGDAPEYNSVDASLWFAVAVHELLERKPEVAAPRRARLERAVRRVLGGYLAGTRHRIRCDADGLLACGEEGVQLTWMDARVDGRVVTPRVGKPVEVQALWIAALESAGRAEPLWTDLARRARLSFLRRFPRRDGLGLYDVVDAWHEAGRCDSALRPNQILALGGLPFPALDPGLPLARRVVDVVEERLWTPLGLRSLDPADPDYRGHYTGDAAAHDAAYHQGSVWPWLLGPFVEAWVRVRGSEPAARRAARRRFLRPLLAQLDVGGLGHVTEIADGDPPHTPRGCPFQAWSLGELLRLDRQVLAQRPGVGEAA